AVVQFELRFLSLGSKSPTHSHLFDRERSAGSWSRNRLVLALGFCARGYESINWLGSRWLCQFGQVLRGNLHERPERNAIIKCGNVARLHPNTAIAGWPTDRLFLRRPMNINTTLKSMRVLRFKAAQPNDTRGYGVASGSIGLQNFASESTIVEHGPGRRVVTNFSGTERRESGDLPGVHVNFRSWRRLG